MQKKIKEIKDLFKWRTFVNKRKKRKEIKDLLGWKDFHRHVRNHPWR